jgi:FdhD protein
MMTETESIVSKQIKKVSPAGISDFSDQLAIEEPLEIRLAYRNGEKHVRKSISVTMRTPGRDEELAVGFLFTEGIIQNASQIRNVKAGLLEENTVLVTLNDWELPVLSSSERNFYTTSSCGVCGKASIDAIKTVSAYSARHDQISVNSHIFLALVDELEKQQTIFESTGGLHASALFELNGSFVTLREDVGRHNALDKVIGSMFLKNTLPLADKILLLSGRASFELIQKAAMAGIKIVAAVGAPSSLAVQLAQESGITLIGFLKNDKFNIYTGWERITNYENTH